jgi:predicted nuclease of predicted toxin-antitoxin system
MGYAKKHNYIVLTHDLDFDATLAATHGTTPSNVQIRSEAVSPNVVGSSVCSALRQMREELAAGALLTVEPERQRLRLLPI